MDAMPPDALPSCFKPQATVLSAALISPASTPSCLSAASSIDNLAGPLSDGACGGAAGPADGASGTERKEGDGEKQKIRLKSYLFRNRATLMMLCGFDSFKRTSL